MTATLDLLGLYLHDSHIFDDMILPDEIDKATLTDNLCLETAGMTVLYPDPVFIRAAIGSWSRKEISVWNQLADTLHYDYNPIHNYDRTEERTHTETRNLKGTDDRDRTFTENRGRTENETVKDGTTDDEKTTQTQNNDNTATTSRTAYDSEALAVAEEVMENGSTDGQASRTLSRNFTRDADRTGTEDLTHTDKDNTTTTDTGTVENDEQVRAYGNIGVTTTQQMIEAQREVVKFNLMDYIIQSFKSRFILLVY